MDVGMFDLWMPILVSAVVVFFASFLAHMVLPHHKKDWGKAANEDALLEYVRSSGIKTGQYMFPGCEDWSELKDPDKKKAYMAGPHGTIRIWSGMPNMGRNLALTFLLYIVIGVFVAYLAVISLDAGEGFKQVFRFVGTASVMAYCLGFVGNTIWFGQPLKPFLNDLADGIVFGLLTGVVFGWLWPALEMVETIKLPAIGG